MNDKWLGFAFAFAAAGAVVSGTIQSNPSPSWGLDVMDGVRDGRYIYPASNVPVRIFIIDGGVLSGHSDFGGRAHSLGDFCSDGPNMTPVLPDGSNEILNDGTPELDGYGGHGTHDASYAAGAYSGVAKTAIIYSLRASGPRSRAASQPDCRDGDPTATKKAVDWLVANANARQPVAEYLPPAIVNISFSFSRGTANQLNPAPKAFVLCPPSVPCDSLSASISQAIDQGFLFTLSGGTGGQVTDHWSQDVVNRALVVGATYSNYAAVAPAGSYGPDLALFAPGANLRGADARSTSSYTVPERGPDCPNCLVQPGDSFAAPFVAGIAAVYLQQHPYYLQRPTDFPAAAKAALLAHAAKGWVSNVGGGTLNRFAQLR